MTIKGNDPAYFIWSNEHCAWWGPGERGYVNEVSKAGRYSKDRAIQICDTAVGGSRNGILNEIPVREDDMLELFKGRQIWPGRF